MSMTALIVDDEPIARKVLREELEVAGDIEVVGEADNGSAALSQILNLKPDVVFLDLQMPEFTGIEVAKRLRQGSHLPAVIVVTAYDQYAIEALDAGAMDYLLKPISQERLHDALERVRRISGKPGEVAERLARLQELPLDVHSARVRKIVGRDNDEYVILNVAEIFAFQADGDLVWILTAKKKYLATQSLRTIQERLQHTNFRRIHRSALVNIDHVRKMSTLTSQRWLLTLSNGIEFIVSKRLAHNVRELLTW
jgi:two-component system LytT family response regulator